MVAAIGAGLATERRAGARATALARTILRLVLYGLLPPITFVNVARLELTADVGLGIVLGWLAITLTGVFAWIVGRYALHLRAPAMGVLINASLHGNTGYLGLPLCTALLGSDELPVALTYDTLVQGPVLLLGVIGVAAAMGARAGETARSRLRTFVVRNPPLLAAAGGLLAPSVLAPDALVAGSRLLIFALLPIGFFALGVLLSAQGEQLHHALPRLTPRVGAAIALRLVVAPLLLLVLAWPLIELPPSYFLMAAMPAGLNVVVVAEAYGLDVQYAVAAIAWTTLISLAVSVGLVLVL